MNEVPPKNLILLSSKIDFNDPSPLAEKATMNNGLGEMHPLTDAKHIVFNDTVSDRTILRMAKCGAFPTFKLNGGKWYFILEIAPKWLVEHHRDHGWLIQKGHEYAQQKKQCQQGTC